MFSVRRTSIIPTHMILLIHCKGYMIHLQILLPYEKKMKNFDNNIYILQIIIIKKCLTDSNVQKSRSTVHMEQLFT